MIKDLLPLLLAKIGPGKMLSEIIGDVLGGEPGDIQKAAARIFNRKVTAQEGRTGAQLFTRAVVKQVDAAFEAEFHGLTLEQRTAIVQEMANNAARELLLAAQAIVKYPEAAAAVYAAKEATDIPALAAARRGRTIGSDAFKNAILNTARAIAGDDPQ